MKRDHEGGCGDLVCVIEKWLLRDEKRVSREIEWRGGGDDDGLTIIIIIIFDSPVKRSHVCVISLSLSCVVSLVCFSVFLLSLPPHFHSLLCVGPLMPKSHVFSSIPHPYFTFLLILLVLLRNAWNVQLLRRLGISSVSDVCKICEMYILCVRCESERKERKMMMVITCDAESQIKQKDWQKWMKRLARWMRNREIPLGWVSLPDGKGILTMRLER